MGAVPIFLIIRLSDRLTWSRVVHAERVPKETRKLYFKGSLYGGIAVKRLSSLFVLCVFAFMAADANAAPEGLYLGLKAGGALEDYSSDMNAGAGSGTVTALGGAPATNPPFGVSLGSKTKAAFLIGAQLGYDFDRRFSVPVRLELDFTYRSPRSSQFGGVVTLPVESPVPQVGPQDINVIHDVKLNLNTLLVNFYFDIPTGTAITPYVGAGAGIAILRLKTTDTFWSTAGPGTPVLVERHSVHASKTKTNFAWSLAAGVAYDISENVALDLGYRFVYAGKIHATYDWTVDNANLTYSVPYQSGIKKIMSHDISFGVRYTF
ncbi:MAG: outer membrane beta-barrel protein [Deltaproteobacteria bacterium]|jgi:opacity protein-like surface antigen|nr:outer membrane beta-barrel protein [Deltaproteobacteria bacterium]